MRFRKYLCSILILLAMILSVSGGVYAGTAVSGPSTAQAGSSAVYVHKEGTYTYLRYKSTNKNVESTVGVREFPAGSGKKYYFLTKNGRVGTGLFKVGKKLYYANSNGVLLGGWRTVNGKTYYFNTSTYRAASGWKTLNGKTYYFDPKTFVRLTGLQKIKYKNVYYTYYLDPKDNGAKTKGWKEMPDKKGKWRYFNSRGRMLTGVSEIGGNLYYLNKYGVRKTGLKGYKGQTYYFDPSTGKAIVGWKTLSGKTYYFNSNTDNRWRALKGWASIGGNTYYFNSKGVMQKGWLTLDGNTYYLDPGTGVLNKTSPKTIDGKTYYFSTTTGARVVGGTYSIRVNMSTNVTTVYMGDTAVRAMYCSPGSGTPLGTFSILDKLRWHELMGPSWGQYCEHLTGSILFHSIPYNRYCDPYSMPASSFNLLGQAVSHGCIRLACIDAYYIYSNCPIGTTVRINYFGYTDPITPQKRYLNKTGYCADPTDPIYK